VLKIACIPAYNCSTTISDIVKKSQKCVERVIVCDDGSKDDTSEKAAAAGAIVIKHEKNLGKGAALKSLFEQAQKLSADVVVTIDADGQFLPEEIPKLIAPIIENRSDIVLGYRFDDKTEMPSYRKAGNKILDSIANLASELPFRDTQSGFRAYSKKALELINFTTNGFAVDAEILIDASKKGLKISEEKVTVLYKTGEKTSTKNPASHFTEVIVSLVELVAIKHPLRYLGITGFVLMIIGIVFSVIVIGMFNETRYFSVPLTLVALGSLVLGAILLLMAVVLFSISNMSKRL